MQFQEGVKGLWVWCPILHKILHLLLSYPKVVGDIKPKPSCVAFAEAGGMDGALVYGKLVVVGEEDVGDAERGRNNVMLLQVLAKAYCSPDFQQTRKIHLQRSGLGYCFLKLNIPYSNQSLRRFYLR